MSASSSLPSTLASSLAGEIERVRLEGKRGKGDVGGGEGGGGEEGGEG